MPENDKSYKWSWKCVAGIPHFQQNYILQKLHFIISHPVSFSIRILQPGHLFKLEFGYF